MELTEAVTIRVATARHVVANTGGEREE